MSEYEYATGFSSKNVENVEQVKKEEKTDKPDKQERAKAILLTLLRDEEIRNYAKAFVSAIFPSSILADAQSGEASNAQEQANDTDAEQLKYQLKQECEAKEKVERLLEQERVAKENAEQIAQQAKNQLDELRTQKKSADAEIQRKDAIIRSLEQQQGKDKETIQSQERQLTDNADLIQTLQEKNRVLHQDKANLDRQLQQERERSSALSREKQSVQRRKDELEQQLSERFAKAWPIFEQYLSCSPEKKRNILTLFHQADTFEAFISNAAQESALSQLWDEWKGAQNRGDADFANLTQNLFLLCFQLVNDARSPEDRYRILATARGDAQDMSTQTLASGSPAQGYVQEVLMKGYENGFSHKVVKKSIVRLR